MKKRSLLIAAILIGVLALVISFAYAQHPRPPLSKMTQKLDLTDEQTDNIKDIQYNFKKSQIGLRADLKTARLELRHAMMQEKPDSKEIANLVDQIAETQKRLLKNNVDRKLALKGILTPEQFEKFHQRKAEWMGERMERGAKRPGHRPPQRGFGSHDEGSEF